MQTRQNLFASGCLLLGMLTFNGCATRTAVVIDSKTDWLKVDAPAKVSVSRTKDGNTWEHIGKVTIPPGMVIGPEPPL